MYRAFLVAQNRDLVAGAFEIVLEAERGGICALRQ